MSGWISLCAFRLSDIDVGMLNCFEMPDKADEFVTLTLPRSAIQDVVALSAALVDRIHVLLERTNDGNLTALERNEAETLVTLAQFSQLVAMSLKAGQSTV